MLGYDIMSRFYADPNPVGVTPPDDADRRNIHKVTGGDALIIDAVVALRDGTPVTPDNSSLHFVLSDQRFSDEHEWQGYWRDGIEQGDAPGRIQITVPEDVTATLRRGAFLYSLVVANKLGRERYTALSGSILVEYEPTSPTHSIPYKD
jgi:hypothetical protein